MTRKGVKPIIAELLNKGAGSAINSSMLQKVTGLDARVVLAQIERERKDGKQIIAKKKDGGGYYLPDTEEELKAYIYNKTNEIITNIETVLSIKNGKKKALSEKEESIVRAILLN